MRIRFLSGSPPPLKNAAFPELTPRLPTHLAANHRMGGGRRPPPQDLPGRKGRGVTHEEATSGRSASHHLQVKAALALLYHVLGSPNPFAQCHAPKFAPEKTELRYHTSSQLGQLLRELREIKPAILAT